jgi:hypothetical protein
MLNEESSFIGSVPEFYERYLVPMHFEAHARIMVARLGALLSGDLLELAAGTGTMWCMHAWYDAEGRHPIAR